MVISSRWHLPRGRTSAVSESGPSCRGMDSITRLGLERRLRTACHETSDVGFRAVEIKSDMAPAGRRTWTGATDPPEACAAAFEDDRARNIADRLRLTSTSDMNPSARTFDRRSTADDVVRGLDLSGKVAIVTGATSGIGVETARALASAGAEVVIGCRDRARGEATAAKIRQRHPAARLLIGALDLASLASVRRFVENLERSKVHVLVCNAGVYEGSYVETTDGFERTVGVCHIGHFLLAQLLLPRLIAAAPSRVVMVSSGSHHSPRTLDFERLPLKRDQYRPLIAYGQAKLCNVLMANELYRRHGKDGITTYSLHPGTLMATSIARTSLGARVLLTLARPFTKTLAQGAATSVWCATAPELEGIGGRYYVDCAENRASREAQNPEVAAKLWEVSEKWVAD